MDSVSKQASIQDSYNPTRFTRLYAVEDRHFWFRVRNQVIMTVASQIVSNLTPGYRVLEVGCGTGNVLRFLEQGCSDGLVIGLDLFGQGLHYARQRVSCHLVQGDIHRLPFSERFDLIGVFDVLEHLQDDMGVLHDLRLALAPTGALLLTVPAHPSLWSYHDDVAHHCRRYEPTTLEDKLRHAGFRVEYITQYMMSTFPLTWLIRRLQKLVVKLSPNNSHPASDIAAYELRIIPVLNNLLAFLLNREVSIIARRYHLPIGTSLLAVARKEE